MGIFFPHVRKKDTTKVILSWERRCEASVFSGKLLEIKKFDFSGKSSNLKTVESIIKTKK